MNRAIVAALAASCLLTVAASSVSAGVVRANDDELVPTGQGLGRAARSRRGTWTGSGSG